MTIHGWVAMTYDDELLWGHSKEEVIKLAKDYILENCYIPYGQDDNKEDTTPVMIAHIDTCIRAEKSGDNVRYIYSDLPQTDHEEPENLGEE